MNGFYIGDIIGSAYAHENESFNKRTKRFDLFNSRSKFSDDTILTFATIKWLMSSSLTSENMFRIIKETYNNYPDTKPTMYGISFANWARAKSTTFRKSSGNGGAMRVSPIAYFASSIDEVDKLVEFAIRPTHNTPNGILSAKIVAHSIYQLLHGMNKKQLVEYLINTFNFNLKINTKAYMKNYTYTSDGLETVKPALISFIESSSFEDSIRTSIAFGGDSDTICSITAAIAEAYYKKIPPQINKQAKGYLPNEFVLLLDDFNHYLNSLKINKL